MPHRWRIISFSTCDLLMSCSFFTLTTKVSPAFSKKRVYAPLSIKQHSHDHPSSIIDLRHHHVSHLQAWSVCLLRA